MRNHIVPMLCLHKLPAGMSKHWWFCNQKPTCNFICSQDERHLYEIGIMTFERTNQSQPKCCDNNLAMLSMLKDVTNPNYGRPFFVCSKDANRCQYFEWGDKIIPPRSVRKEKYLGAGEKSKTSEDLETTEDDNTSCDVSEKWLREQTHKQTYKEYSEIAEKKSKTLEDIIVMR